MSSTGTDQPSKAAMGIPPSVHMHLGRGLSSHFRSRHTSCFDLDAYKDEDMGQLRPSFSESDLSSLFDKDGYKNMELDMKRIQPSSETSSSEQAESQDIEMCDGIE